MSLYRFPVPGAPVKWIAASNQDWLAIRGQGNEGVVLWCHLTNGVPTNTDLVVEWDIEAGGAPSITGWALLYAVQRLEVDTLSG